MKTRESYSLNKTDLERAFKKHNFHLSPDEVDEIYQMMIQMADLEEGAEFSGQEFFDIMMGINAHFLQEFRQNKF